MKPQEPRDNELEQKGIKFQERETMNKNGAVNDLGSSSSSKEKEVLMQGSGEIRKEIEFMELMLAKCTMGLLETQMMKNEIETLRGCDEKGVTKEMEAKRRDLEKRQQELKMAIEWSISEKWKELMKHVDVKNKQKTRNDQRKRIAIAAAYIGAFAIMAVLVLIRGANKTQTKQRDP